MKRFLVMLCVIALLLTASGSQVSGSTNLSADFIPKKSIRWEDAAEGSTIDIRNVLIADDGNHIAFAVQAQNPIYRKLLAGRHMYFLLETLQSNSLNTSPNKGLSPDYVIELLCIEEGGLSKFALAVHKVQEDDVGVYPNSEDVTQTPDGNILIARIPASSIGNPAGFRWELHIREASNFKLYDYVPEGNPGAYMLYKDTSIDKAGTGAGKNQGPGDSTGTIPGPDNNTGAPSNDATDTARNVNQNTSDLEGGPTGDEPNPDTINPQTRTGSPDFSQLVNFVLSKMPTPTIKSTTTDKKPKSIFKDTAIDDWFYGYIGFLAETGIAKGYSDKTFKPNSYMTRAEFTKMILKALSKTTKKHSITSFSDTLDHWARDYIEEAADLGITNGYMNDTFRPDNKITRQEVTKMICTAIKLIPVNQKSGFADSVDSWADKYIAALRANGLISGYSDGTFRPKNHVTRAEAAKMIFLMINT